MLFIKNIANCNKTILNDKKSIESLKVKCFFNAFKANNRTFCMLIV